MWQFEKSFYLQKPGVCVGGGVMNSISHTPALGFVNRSWVTQSCSASPMVTKIGLIVVKDPNGVLTVDVFVNNQQYKIDISVNHLICLSLSSKVKERKFLMYRALIAYIRKVYTTDNLSQIETQSWRICQLCQHCRFRSICENLGWLNRVVQECFLFTSNYIAHHWAFFSRFKEKSVSGIKVWLEKGTKKGLIMSVNIGIVFSSRRVMDPRNKEWCNHFWN